MTKSEEYPSEDEDLEIMSMEKGDSSSLVIHGDGNLTKIRINISCL
jgi:hypothetical protein